MKATVKKEKTPHSEKRQLSKKFIDDISSPYLAGNRDKEKWEIVKIEVDEDNNGMTAYLRMASYYVSPTDKGGFHLTQLSTFEFLSQLTIIMSHVWAGLEKKTSECWMIESSINCKKAIRDPENIKVEMKIEAVRQVNCKILITTHSKVTDKEGLFEGVIKGLVS